MAPLNKALFSSAKEDWATPQDFFDKLDQEFHFNLDPCADEENAKCKEFFTKEENGLLKDWGALCLLQSTIRKKNNRRMDPEMLRRSTEAGNGCCCAYSGTY